MKHEVSTVERVLQALETIDKVTKVTNNNARTVPFNLKLEVDGSSDEVVCALVEPCYGSELKEAYNTLVDCKFIKPVEWQPTEEEQEKYFTPDNRDIMLYLIGVRNSQEHPEDELSVRLLEFATQVKNSEARYKVEAMKLIFYCFSLLAPISKEHVSTVNVFHQDMATDFLKAF